MKYLLSIIRPPFVNQLAFYSLMASGAYIIFLWSPHVMGNFFSRYTKIIIYIFPWLLVWLCFSWQVVTNRAHRLEILLIISIIILGIVNVALSKSPAVSFPFMRNFLLTGIFALWTSMFLLTDPQRRQGFDLFCAGALAVFILGEAIVYGVRGDNGPQVFQVFTLHPIPLGTLIILLSTGPMRLIRWENFTAKVLGWLLVLAGGSLIYLSHKRGTWLALAAMVAVGMLYLVRRQKYLLLSLLVVMGLILPLQAKSRFARLDPAIGHDITILHRLELYRFALHVWKTHPIMGIGLRSFTHEQYLTDYQPHNSALHDFPQAVAAIQTFDNMGLTALVELGSLMTILYVGLVAGIMVKYCRKLWQIPEFSTLAWYRVLVLFGWAVHSLSYDSLLFPSINWLFHVQLGIMAGYRTSETAPD
jgi:O-antigen ligase